MVIDLIFKALLLLCCVRHAGSGLSLYAYRSIGTDEINGLDEEIDIECNSNFSLWCEVKPYIDSATWEINGKSAALCFHGNCFEYPPFPENHMFSMNTTTGDFIMDVSPVTNATNGNTYKCDDGQNSRSVIPVIKAFPTSQTLKIDTSENTKITVTTGCVFPKKETDLDFDWFISKNNVNPSKEEALSAISNISTVNECTETNCAGLDTAYFNVTATFEVYDEEESYYICVKVTHIDAKSRPAEICSDRQYQVLKKSKQDCNLIIIILLIVSVRVFALQDFLTACYFVSTREDAVDERCKWMKFLASLPVSGIIFPVIVIKHMKEDDFDEIYKWMKNQGKPKESAKKIVIFELVCSSILTCLLPCFAITLASYLFVPILELKCRALFMVTLIVLLVIEILEYVLLSCTEVLWSTAPFWSINTVYITIFVVCVHSLFTKAYRKHHTDLKIEPDRYHCRSHMQALCHFPIIGFCFACYNFYQRGKNNKVQQQRYTSNNEDGDSKIQQENRYIDKVKYST